MRFSLRSAAVFAICLLVSIPPASAWDSIGHMAVAYVAWQQLTPATQKRAIALLKKNPYYKKKWRGLIPAGTSAADTNLYLFMMASTWADEIKASNSGYKDDSNTPPKTSQASQNIGYRDKYMHKYWHFIDTPFSTDGTALPPIPAPNVETQIGVFRQTLASDAGDSLKSYDLSWILHLIGDAHQPLHCTTRVTSGEPQGDAGGNDVRITNPDKELHAYWDNILGKGDTSDFKKAVTVAQQLPAASATSGDGNEADWVQEGFRLAQSSVYAVPVGPALGPYTLDAPYNSNSLAVARQQVALAGTRLANLLNTNLK